MPTGSIIRFTGIDRQYKNLREELLDVTDKVYSSGQVLDGLHTLTFEAEMASRTKRKHAIAVNSCSQALLISYVYYASINSPGTVAVPALGFPAISNAPHLAGRDVTFVDVDHNSIMDISKIDIVKDNIGIISYVNMFGNLIDYDKLQLISGFFSTKKVLIVEDAAQSFGAFYNGVPSGKLGNVSCLSFDPTKNLPNYGSGGMILTDDHNLLEFAKDFRSNSKHSSFRGTGTNSKMSEIDCAQMSIKLQHFDAWQERRAKIAKYYNECLFPYVAIPEVTPGCIHAWHKYVINTIDQELLPPYLLSNGIETKIHYSQTLPDTGLWNRGSSNWPIADTLTRLSLSLPIYPELLDSEVEHVVSTIQKFYD